MKTEKEILKLADVMRERAEMPCECRGTDLECVINTRQLQAAVAVLLWVCDKNPDFDRTAEDIFSDVAKWKEMIGATPDA